MNERIERGGGMKKKKKIGKLIQRKTSERTIETAEGKQGEKGGH